MRPRVLAIAVAAIAASASGCSPSGSAKLEGHWRGARADGVGAGVQDAANTFAKQTEITSHGNQLTISTPQSKGQQDTYVVDDENRTTLVLHTDKDGPANKETFAFGQDGETMTWRLGEGRSIVFKKLKN